MGQRERSNDGRFAETVTPARVFEVLTEVADPIATAGDVAEVLGCTPEAARVKLAQLVEDGRVERRKVGGAAVVWWPAEHAQEEHPAEALWDLVGILSEEEADRVRERSHEIRESINGEVAQTRDELDKRK